MKFFVAVIAFFGVLALATASPKPQIISPYGPQGIYGGGSASAYGMADASQGLYGNNAYGPGILPGYAGLGGYVPNYGGYMSAYPF